MGNNNSIGGTSAAARNIISGNSAQGVVINGAGNMVQGNYIGTGADGVSNLGNSFAGILIQASNNTIGGIAAGASNAIAYNGGVAGVRVAVGSGNAILSNSIFANLGLGISVDPGANNNQAAPILNSVIASGGQTIFQGTSAALRTRLLTFSSLPTTPVTRQAAEKARSFLAQPQ